MSITSLIRGPRAAMLPLALAAFVAAPAQAQWVTPTTSGTPILSTINPKTIVTPTPTLCTNTGAAPVGDQLPVEQQSATLATAKFGGLPGSAAMPGYIPVPGVPFVAKTLQTGSPAKTVGTLYDRVYCTGSGGTCDATKTYVFATRVILNATVANANGTTFEVNDIFRTVPTAASVSVGYYMGTSGTSVDTGLATKYLEYAGRTNNGLNQTILRDNTKIAFRADTNANDPERCEPYSQNSPIGPWVYARMTCANGVGTAAVDVQFKARVRQGGEESQPIVSISTDGYICKP